MHLGQDSSSRTIVSLTDQISDELFIILLGSLTINNVLFQTFEGNLCVAFVVWTNQVHGKNTCPLVLNNIPSSHDDWTTVIFIDTFKFKKIGHV